MRRRLGGSAAEPLFTYPSASRCIHEPKAAALVMFARSSSSTAAGANECGRRTDPAGTPSSAWLVLVTHKHSTGTRLMEFVSAPPRCDLERARQLWLGAQPRQSRVMQCATFGRG